VGKLNIVITKAIFINNRKAASAALRLFNIVTTAFLSSFNLSPRFLK